MNKFLVLPIADGKAQMPHSLRLGCTVAEFALDDKDRLADEVIE
jgi:hypothetical protein